MQTTRNFVALATELAASVQYGEHHFKGTLALVWPGWIGVNGNTAAVVDYFTCTIVMQGDGDFVAKASHGFVHRVVDYFPNEVMQASQTRGTDVHSGPTTHRVKALEYLNILGAVGASGLANGAFCGITGAIYCHGMPWQWCGVEMHK